MNWKPNFTALEFRAVLAGLLAAVSLLLQTGCVAPVGAVKASPARTYRQTHDNAVSHGRPSRDTQSALHRFDQDDRFGQAPDATLELIHEKAVASRDRDLLFVLSELNYLAAEQVSRSVQPWDPRDARDYYLASAVYAWFYLFGDAAQAPPSAFDTRFRTACDFYNYGLGWALTERRSTNGVAILAGGTRRLPMGQIEIEFNRSNSALPLEDFDRFVVADHFLVRGLSVRKREPGLGTPLVGVQKMRKEIGFARAAPATVLLRLNGGLSDLAQGRCRGSLELYPTFDATTVRIGDRSVPLEADTTVHLAYTLNQSSIWGLDLAQFLSGEEKVPTDVYLTQPYEAGRVPVVFVHGTFSSPVWWVEMFNTLSADPELRKRCQFWHFIYNSGNPVAYSAVRLRESLMSKIKELDPEGKDPALRQMVVVGHSQGGLLTKLTATDTGDRLVQTMLKTNQLAGSGLTAEQQQFIQTYARYEALPFVNRVIFISTPHRGSYKAAGVARRMARRLVKLAPTLIKQTKELTGLADKLDFPKEFRGALTSIDGMSPRNPFLRALADIPLAPGVHGHSIIPVKGEGDCHRGKDGVVSYESAHVDYVESEFIVRGPHSCQSMPPTIEEVRRILQAHLSGLPAGVTNRAAVQ